MGYQLKKKADKKYTWQDYLTWPDEKRWEVTQGTPVPTALVAFTVNV